jgi:zinc and cadmium transporter
LVALAAGTMLSTGLFELLPEAAHLLGLETSLWILAATFAALLGAEKILHWHHCHDEDCEDRPLGYMNLGGDAIHNFLDGIVIAAAFQVSVPIGIATTFAVALHELPQEIGDFGVLVHSGFSRTQAVLANLSVALVAVIGGFFGFWLTQASTDLSAYLLPVAAGTFLYLAAVDLIPEFRHEEIRWKSVILFLCFLIGLFGLPLTSEALGLEHGEATESIEQFAEL